MDAHHGIDSCRWARPTLFLPYPLWLEAENTPWTCVRPMPPKLLETTDVCRTCPNVEPKPAGVVGDGR